MGDNVVEALKDICFTVDPGEYVAVLGPSGSGKSTLMNIVGCMDTMTSGEYYLAGIPIQQMQDSQLTMVRNVLIGFIFQRYHLISTYTVLQNAMMPLLVRGASYKDAKRRRRRNSRCWAWASGSIISRMSFPAASSSVSPLRGLWSVSRSCCSPTNRPAPSTARPARKS
jgi:ABC-type methionine transport system ATPase subunit